MGILYYADSPMTSARKELPLFALGLLLFGAGPIVYAIQLWTHVLWMPWYVPLFSTLGLVAMMASFRRRPNALRGLAVLLFLLVCSLEWYFSVSLVRSPAYAGAIMTGQSIPAFSAQLSDGSAFSQADLQNGTPTALVFFRGRW